MPKLIRSFAFVPLLWASSVAAQGYGSYGTGINFSNMHMNTLINNLTPRAEEEKTQQDKPPAAPATTPASLTFQPSTTVRRDSYRNFAQGLRAKGQGEAAALSEQIVSQMDVIAAMDTTMQAKFDMRATNLADVFAIWAIGAWQATQQSTQELPVAAYRAVQAQFAKLLLDSGALTNVTDADKQKLAEILLLETMMMDSAMKGAAGDPQRGAQIAKSAQQSLKSVGIDPDTMVLGPTGFALKERD